ncbi:hypothetical protein K491DRAFT_269643 [Lophiostoma macrostomum CBS 122681]|uniref:Uncharacterized protein n=1 Tax=Lophiostoma macrostomum CBS 122681 TaxID=1314788 RepID=A0A6A6TIJ3_9PLEO|nr:hypothetical protein K491DRAFT_269643 [Lophiostoma macrostomum CBS 122681]
MQQLSGHAKRSVLEPTSRRSWILATVTTLATLPTRHDVRSHNSLFVELGVFLLCQKASRATAIAIRWPLPSNGASRD